MSFHSPNTIREPQGELHSRSGATECGYLITPPSSAASSTDTITTTDEDARNCEEWDLFPECERVSCPTSESKLLSLDDLPSIFKSDECLTDSETDDSDAGENKDIVLAKETEQREPLYRLILPGEQVTSREECAIEASTAHEETCAVLVAAKSSDIPPTSARPSTSFSTSNGDQPVSSATSSRIKVFVRVRPRSRWEPICNTVSVGEEGKTLRVHSTTTGSVTESTVDMVFGENSIQESVFAAVEPGIHAALDGINATIFAYGQTGTGKTYTMFGDEASSSPSSEATTVLPSWGLIPRVFWELCGRARAISEKASVKLTTSFLQIYNDRVFDLLTDRKRQKPLILREQPSGDGTTNVILQGLLCVPVPCFAEALRLVEQGRANRSVRETEQNSSSSRSHAIVQIHITTEVALKNGDKRTRTSRFNLVDLAGSEKWNTDIDMEDYHTIELKNINASLSALGNCIAALAETGRRHIPYRDSTLTRLLQDSFGGNTMSFLIATISPSSRASEETIRTLQFADRARSVMQVIRVNESYSGSSELLAAKAQIKALRERLAHEQKRRRETRIKEHEAMAKDFAAKLQAKDDELKQAIRDNQVFSKWREEDLKRIRELEARVKAMECCAGMVSDSDQLDDSATSNERAPNDNQGSESLTRGTSLVAGLSKKAQNRTLVSRGQRNGPISSTERIAQPRGGSYRSLINKYTGQKQDGRCRLDEGNRCGDNNQPSNQENTCSKSFANSIHHDPVNSPQGWESQLARPTGNLSFQAQQLHAETNHSSSPKLQVNSQTIDFAGIGGSGAKAIAALGKAESLPTLRMGVRDNSVTSSHEYVGQDPISKFAWQLPVVQSTSNPEPAAIARGESPRMSLASEVCTKHSLKGCVLCAVNESRSQVMSVKSVISSQMPHSPSVSSMTPSFTASNNQPPCERHRLPGCFICMKSTVEPVWKSSTSMSSPSPSVPNSITTSANISQQVDSKSLPRPQQDAKCSVHTLTNCVLCAGALASRPNGVRAPMVEQPSASTTRLQSESPWRTGQISPIDPGASSALFGTGSFPTLASMPGKSSSVETFEPYQPRVDNTVITNQTSPSVRHSIRDVPGDVGSKRQFHSLVRDASNAATIVLRRR